MPDVQLAFGLRQTYFVDTPKKWGWKALPAGLRKDDLFPPGSTTQVKRIFNISFGQETWWYKLWGDNYFIAWQDVNGKNWYKRDLPEYHTLEAWLGEQECSIQVDDIEVVLGETADQFFARSSNSYRWKGLHHDLDAKLKNYSRDPSTKAHVALGLGTNFILYDSDNVSQTLWAVSAYPSLDSILASWGPNTSEKGKIMYASLNQFQPDQYFIIFEKGEVHWKLPTAWASQVQEFIDFYQEELAEEQRRSARAALDDEEPLALTTTRTGRARRSWGIIPRGRRGEMLNVFLGSFGAASGIVQIALAVAPMCTIL